jgi:protein-L-isoaspartate(D-aspartate) O-methyltransferase
MAEAAGLIEELRGAIRDERVLGAIAAVPRERFVPPAQRARAYENVALPIGCEQTISQPLVVGRMLEALHLTGTEAVLDVGTGSGYHAALLARLAARVWTVERHPELSAQAQRTCRALGIENVEFAVGDGRAGLPAHAPYDAINVAAAGDEVPPALVRQLRRGGRLVLPVGSREQHLVLVRRGRAGITQTQLDPVRFVPLVGEGG